MVDVDGKMMGMGNEDILEIWYLSRCTSSLLVSVSVSVSGSPLSFQLRSVDSVCRRRKKKRGFGCVNSDKGREKGEKGRGRKEKKETKKIYIG